MAALNNSKEVFLSSAFQSGWYPSNPPPPHRASYFPRNWSEELISNVGAGIKSDFQCDSYE